MEEKKRVTKAQAFLLLAVAVVMVFVGLKVIEASTPVVLSASGVVLVVIAVLMGFDYATLQADIIKVITAMLVPVLILLAVGALVGTWMICGTVPYLIDLGMRLISPNIFLVVVCVVCAIMSVASGTSWGTVSTVGVAFMGVSVGLNVPLAYTAGAVVSGAIFGDKLSPLSDSTVLTSAACNLDIVRICKFAMKSTVPAFLISLVIYLVLGLNHEGSVVEGGDYTLILETLGSAFRLNPALLLPPVVVFALILLKKPTLPCFVAGIVTAAVLAILVQGRSIPEVAAAIEGGFTDSTGVAIVDSMVQRGGFNSMLSTVALLIASGIFGAPLRTTGVVDVLLDMMVQATKNGRVMACYVFFIHTIFFLITGSFYVTCTVLGPMVAPLFPKYGLSKVNLGRILLDTGVGFSPIVPWAMMGGFISNTLGVAVTDYFLFATLPYLNMIISLLYLITGFTVVPAGPDEAEQPQEQS